MKYSIFILLLLFSSFTTSLYNKQTNLSRADRNRMWQHISKTLRTKRSLKKLHDAQKSLAILLSQKQIGENERGRYSRAAAEFEKKLAPTQDQSSDASEDYVIVIEPPSDGDEWPQPNGQESGWEII